ncbi:MAG TPA: hypothetical protein VMW16_11990 [Sedimentisphaerales bacterium]|nr:hypothetical protein [Sedimentisphaerales bacterium]
MSLTNFERHVDTLFKGIDSCEANKLVLPALMLIYSGIDIVASLERKKGEGTQASFTRWVDMYLLKAVSLPCTSLELYAARCGILHGLTPESGLSRKGKAREVAYAWGIAKVSVLQEAASRSGYDYPVIHISQLKEAFCRGVALFLKEASRDQETIKRISEGAGLWFSEVGVEIVDAYLSVTESDKVE